MHSNASLYSNFQKIVLENLATSCKKVHSGWCEEMHNFLIFQESLHVMWCTEGVLGNNLFYILKKFRPKFPFRVISTRCLRSKWNDQLWKFTTFGNSFSIAFAYTNELCKLFQFVKKSKKQPLCVIYFIYASKSFRFVFWQRKRELVKRSTRLARD